MKIFSINMSHAIFVLYFYVKPGDPRNKKIYLKKKSILTSEKAFVPALARLGNAFSIAANLPVLERSFRSVSWDWGSGMMDFVEMNSPPSVWLPWPTTSFYSLGSYSLCLPLQSLLHKIPKEEVAFHSLLKHKDWQEKEAQRHSY